ncbi:uncharacterized protein [Diabrotica undecimpunctata]|uniref:uncharacterized protein n=1 Tax=Diabrotica undecimpunctata TaxID=50387 RepID=UPI003B6356B9
MTEEGFSKGQSDNLPIVNMFMVATYFQNGENFSLGEVRGVKADKSGRESYGDAAVGWVQVKRNNMICTVRAKITPEHNVKKKQYAVSCEINEETEEVLDLKCYDCAASLGGCKHQIAFLMWLHRRSEEPSKTEVTCYWAKSKLSKVGTSIKYLTLKDFGAPEELSSDEDSNQFLQEVIDMGIKNQSESQLLQHFKDDNIKEIGIFQLRLKFISTEQTTYSEFVEFCSNNMSEHICSEAAIKTSTQSDSSLWFELRYGRITASKLYDAAHCKKCDGAFVEQILGVSKFKATSAMNRGKQLEESMIKCVQKVFQIKLNRIGLQLNPKFPIFGASPDVICEEYIVEIKCPQTNKTVANYLTKDNKITAKYNAQVQLQMFMFAKKKCLFCVADPEFENNSNFNYTWVDYDENHLESLMTAAESFWTHNIFPRLLKSVDKK